MIIVRTPLHISLFESKGARAGITSSIDKYASVQMRPLPAAHPFKFRLVWDKLEQAKSAAELSRPLARAVFQHYGERLETGLETICSEDLPAHTGLGGEAARTISLLHGVFTVSGAPCSKKFLAGEAIRLRRDALGETPETIAAAAAAFGGFNRIDVEEDGGFRVTPIKIAAARAADLNARLKLFVAKPEARAIETPATTPSDDASAMARVAAAQNILGDENTPLDGLAPLMHEAWVQARAAAARPADSGLERVYDDALGAGALSGRCFGGGRAWLFYVAPENAGAVQAALPRFTPAPFAFDTQGAAIVFPTQAAAVST